MGTGRLANHIFKWLYLGSSLLRLWHLQLPQGLFGPSPGLPYSKTIPQPSQNLRQVTSESEWSLQLSHNGMSCLGRAVWVFVITF